ncbi:MAG TPA: hypothetical protein VHC49_17875 [Mycobacteriales bacterium]|nr:hypothetical protein [Mycobacteriales bacterium]
MSHLIMIHGVCWGVGQSTLCRRLASAIPEVDVLWEDEFSQPGIFTRPEFADVADRFRRRNADPAAGISCPPAVMLEDAYRRLVRTVRQHGRPALMGWSVLDLSEDLDWAGEEELCRHARVTHDIFAPLDPVLIHLEGDITAAFERALAQRGRAWFTGGQPVPDDQWPDRRRALLADAAVTAGRCARAFAAGGWFPALRIDATTVDADAVYDTVAEHLRQSGVQIS